MSDPDPRNVEAAEDIHRDALERAETATDPDEIMLAELIAEATDDPEQFARLHESVMRGDRDSEESQ